MRFPVPDGPPPLTVTVSYRELYEHGAFAQRDLETDGRLASMARDRRLAHWIGQQVPEADDQRCALCPILFVNGGYSSGHSVPPVELEGLTFREEVGPQPWSDYAWEAWGHPEVSPMYSPWQLLYLDVVAREDGVDLPIDLVLGPFEELERQLDLVRPLIERQRGLLDAIDATWRPLIKMLVAIQNVYWPKVRGRISLTLSVDGEHHFAGDTKEAPDALLARLGCSIGEVMAAYEFLVERGLDREPEDEGMVILRRFVPRDYHVRWRGPVQHAQDHFDAAQMLYLWLTDLTAKPPGRPESWPADGRQAQRFALYDNGFALHTMTDALKRELIENELYPHGPAVIGEGPSERIIVDWLVQELLGLRGAIEFHELGGSGEAKRVPRLVEILDQYAAEAFLIVDNEGDMARYVDKAVTDGKLDRENVLLADDSLEQSNFTPAELIQVAMEIAAHPPPDGRATATLALTPEELVAKHSERRSRIHHDKPGLADTLLILAEQPDHGCVRVDKLELAEGLAKLLITELRQATSSAEVETLKERRPITRFVIERLCPVLNRPRPIS